MNQKDFEYGSKTLPKYIGQEGSVIVRELKIDVREDNFPPFGRTYFNFYKDVPLNATIYNSIGYTRAWLVHEWEEDEDNPGTNLWEHWGILCATAVCAEPDEHGDYEVDDCDLNTYGQFSSREEAEKWLESPVALY